jgi:hypothetical protein
MIEPAGWKRIRLGDVDWEGIGPSVQENYPVERVKAIGLDDRVDDCAPLDVDPQGEE